MVMDILSACSIGLQAVNDSYLMCFRPILATCGEYWAVSEIGHGAMCLRLEVWY